MEGACLLVSLEQERAQRTIPGGLIPGGVPCPCGHCSGATAIKEDQIHTLVKSLKVVNEDLANEDLAGYTAFYSQCIATFCYSCPQLRLLFHQIRSPKLLVAEVFSFCVTGVKGNSSPVGKA